MRLIIVQLNPIPPWGFISSSSQTYPHPSLCCTFELTSSTSCPGLLQSCTMCHALTCLAIVLVRPGTSLLIQGEKAKVMPTQQLLVRVHFIQTPQNCYKVRVTVVALRSTERCNPQKTTPATQTPKKSLKIQGICVVGTSKPST
jgi:hypothetical protein